MRSKHGSTDRSVSNLWPAQNITWYLLGTRPWPLIYTGSWRMPLRETLSAAVNSAPILVLVRFRLLLLSTNLCCDGVVRAGVEGRGIQLVQCSRRLGLATCSPQNKHTTRTPARGKFLDSRDHVQAERYIYGNTRRCLSKATLVVVVAITPPVLWRTSPRKYIPRACSILRAIL